MHVSDLIHVWYDKDITKTVKHYSYDHKITR